MRQCFAPEVTGSCSNIPIKALLSQQWSRRDDVRGPSRHRSIGLCTSLIAGVNSAMFRSQTFFFFAMTQAAARSSLRRCVGVVFRALCVCVHVFVCVVWMRCRAGFRSSVRSPVCAASSSSYRRSRPGTRPNLHTGRGGDGCRDNSGGMMD